MSARKRALVVQPCDPTEYGAFIEDAKKRTARGERQAWCPKCQRWRWPGECRHEAVMTSKRKKPTKPRKPKRPAPATRVLKVLV